MTIHMKQDLPDKILPPLWLMYPYISQFSIGWRMGIGESYAYTLGEWVETLTKEQYEIYQQHFPCPKTWYPMNEQTLEIDWSLEYTYKEYCCKLWREGGEPEYTKSSIEQEIGTGILKDAVFFWKPGIPEDGLNPTDATCLGQWSVSPFCVDTNQYDCAEQYMMAEKARLFGDDEIEKAIMCSKDPKQIKALGRKVKNFDETIWQQICHTIVLTGNYYKFLQNPSMLQYLLSTENKVLVEASPLDRIWGIGLGAENHAAQNPVQWRGKNMLGFALMEVRDELRRVCEYANNLPWEQLYQENGNR